MFRTRWLPVPTYLIQPIRDVNVSLSRLSRAVSSSTVFRWSKALVSSDHLTGSRVSNLNFGGRHLLGLVHHEPGLVVEPPEQPEQALGVALSCHPDLHEPPRVVERRSHGTGSSKHLQPQGLLRRR